jgi:hypothetical protein
MKTRPLMPSPFWRLGKNLNAVKLLILAGLSTLMFNLGTLAHADDEKPPAAKTEKSGKTTGDKKKTNIDFEDELVEGELKKPELFYLLQKKQFNFKRLIKLREDFLPEMRRDADEIRRGRSKN